MDVILFQPGNKIKGESNVKGYEDWIQLLSISHGFSMQMTTDVSNATRTSGKPNIQDIACVKYLDASSPKLYQACLQAVNLETSTFMLARNSGEKIDELFKITLHNPLIPSVAVQANPGDMPTGWFTLNFSAIVWEYKQQGVDLKTTGTVGGSWNVATNTSIV